MYFAQMQFNRSSAKNLYCWMQVITVGLEINISGSFTVVPASATLFDKNCSPLLELGTGPYNTVGWNRKGTFLCLAGFGNLRGDMAFWDYANIKQLGTTTTECSVTTEWPPDGQYFMTATTAPRLQVDNGDADHWFLFKQFYACPAMLGHCLMRITTKQCLLHSFVG
ncbi:hypothetical protein JCGZ_05715 [Jatropha curcas]|uniref:Translation initiation factor beta propellor-like domain-containing protein n=1 Tax=Jatropha curcas TaxID=180498 RepID=A0A067LAN0_JATCU|nr:hypothetical protein JCGZ_05715 [Jatropha curcas]